MHFTRYSVAVLMAGALASTACKTDLTALNENPNSPTVAPAAALFTNAAVTEVRRFAGFSLSGTSLFAEHVPATYLLDYGGRRVGGTQKPSLPVPVRDLRRSSCILPPCRVNAPKP